MEVKREHAPPHAEPANRHDHKVLIVCIIIIALFTIAFFIGWDKTYSMVSSISGKASSITNDPYSRVPEMPLVDGEKIPDISGSG